MNNVFDLAEYKKRKRKLKIANVIEKYKVLIAFLLLFSTNILIWAFISLKAAILFLGVMVLTPLIFSRKNETPAVEPSSMKKTSSIRPQ
ncbi:hypothetical protein [Neobacillus sp. LXY-4]|uniref:hypothetical protein n=1 Tax=Neobacillus sp. LXY-4 TaxID=3379826 RepID=UPI003EE1C460